MSGKGGRGGGRGNPAGRGTWRARGSRPRFIGACESLKGCVFDVMSGRQSDTFTKNMRRIADYVGSTTKSFAGDIRHVVEYETDPTIDMPTDPTNGATATETRIWEKEVDLYMRRKG
jgi:hypothetical protein